MRPFDSSLPDSIFPSPSTGGNLPALETFMDNLFHPQVDRSFIIQLYVCASLVIVVSLIGGELIPFPLSCDRPEEHHRAMGSAGERGAMKHSMEYGTWNMEHTADEMLVGSIFAVCTIEEEWAPLRLWVHTCESSASGADVHYHPLLDLLSGHR